MSVNTRIQLLAVVAAALAVVQSVTADAQSVESKPPTRYAVVEVYFAAEEGLPQEVGKVAETFCSERKHIRLHTYVLDGAVNQHASDRLDKIARAFRVEKVQLPLIYCCNRVLNGASDPEQLSTFLQTAFRMEVYVRHGCSRCARAEAYLPRLEATYPCFEVVYFDIASEAEAREQLHRLVRQYRASAASVPAFHFCNQLIVGFDSPATTGARIEKVLSLWTVEEKPPATERSKTTPGWTSAKLSWLGPSMPAMVIGLVGGAADRPFDSEVEAAPLPPLPLPGDLQNEGDDAADVALPADGYSDGGEPQSIDLPWLGRLAVEDWGMPAFTLLVGLVDGFNPCAMWVLVLLLSILVNVRSRARILLIAGIFVLVSGLAYFAFMAAWLNVFLLVGYLRPIQVLLGLLAIVIGAIHVKDFFAFKQGISLSIPESAKPGIYSRVRRIVNAENLWGALLGVTVLAVMVNIVELLCTAGLPALYSEVLTQQGYPAWLNYAYLALYNVAYMADDTLMVAAVVVTLGKAKMQEHHGRWLKLLSGSVILLLGLVMLLKPEWLI